MDVSCQHCSQVFTITARDLAFIYFECSESKRFLKEKFLRSLYDLLRFINLSYFLKLSIFYFLMSFFHMWFTNYKYLCDALFSKSSEYRCCLFYQYQR